MFTYQSLFGTFSLALGALPKPSCGPNSGPRLPRTREAHPFAPLRFNPAVVPPPVQLLPLICGRLGADYEETPDIYAGSLKTANAGKWGT